VKQRCLSEDFIAINDNKKRFAMGLYAKCNGGERELANRETERECVCERQSVSERGKWRRYKDHHIYINIKRKCKAIRRTDYADNDIAATIATAHLFFP
jgi:hypothetical protein